MIIRKFRIFYIHFIRKPIFIFRIKTGLIKSCKKFATNYFLEGNDFFNENFKIRLIEINSSDKILEEAEIIIQNKFQTLGSDLIFLGEKINWHQDFKSGRIWEKLFYTKINSKESIKGSDIKVPWELSRFHQAQYLAKAYLITNDLKFTKKFFDLVNDWIDENPFCYGVNWNCPMEVAIRAVNWIFALHIFKNSKNFTLDIQRKIYYSLYQHGLFIRNNLEYGRRNGNHYLSDLMGLIWLGAFFINTSFGKKWFNFAQKELEKEIFIQVYDDGVDYEKSTFYQRLVTEILTLSLIASEKIGKSFSQEFKNRLHNMFKFISSFTLDDEVPNVGDCDNGRILKFNFSEKISEMRNLLAIGSIIFDDKKLNSQNHLVDSLLLLGLEGLEKLSRLLHSNPVNESKEFPEGGFFILRSRDLFIFFDGGDIGMDGWGGHGHNDILSFELAYKKKRFIVDSGTYTYTPDPQLRQKFRSTESHNTIMVDKKEQAEFLNLFRIKEDNSNPKVTCLSFNNPDKDMIEVEHFAYTRLMHPIIVRRRIELDKLNSKVKIEDSFIGKGQNRIDIFYHFHPDVEINKLTNYIYELKRDNLILRFELPQLNHYLVKLENVLYSESYGQIQTNKRIRITIDKKYQFPEAFTLILKAMEL